MNKKSKSNYFTKLFCAGFRLVPAPYKTKNPVLKDWQHRWIKTEEELEVILSKTPKVNFVIIPHPEWIVYDIDPRNGGLDSFERLKGAFAPTFKVKTGGGGFHYYYRLPAGFNNPLSKNLDSAGYSGIDIKTSTGCLVAPGSVHPSGNLYEIADDSIEDITEVPKSLLELAIKRDNYIEPAPQSVSVKQKEIVKGSRNNFLTGLAGRLFRDGLSFQSVLDILFKFNQEKCKPPLPKREVASIVKSINRYNNAEQAKRQQEARQRELEEMSAAQRVEDIMTNPKIKAEIKVRLICEEIIRDINEHGKFYKSGRNYYIFDNNTKILISLDKGNINLKRLLAGYRINAAREMFKAAYEALVVYCDTEGEETNVFKYAHFDSNTCNLYLKNGNNILKITDENVELCDNGTDRVLFSDNINVAPYEYKQNIERDFLNEYLLGLPNYSNSSYLTGKDIKILVEIYLHAIFMPELLQTKPIISTVGTKGSGKTTLLRMMIKCAYGNTADVISMTNKMEDLDTIVANKHFIVIDNLDTYKESINDKIACYATGVTNEKRKLYSNGEVYSERVEAFLGISTRNPVFRRDDVAQRVLIIYLDPLVEYSTEGSIMTPMLEHRSEILSQIITNLQRVIGLIKSRKYAGYKSKFRMADFAHFTALYLDSGEVAEELLHRVVKTQQALVIEGDILLTLLTKYVHQNRNCQDGWITARMLYKELDSYIQQEIQDTQFKNDFRVKYDNPISLAKRLMNIRQEIEDFIIVETKRARGNIIMYQLSAGKNFADWEESLLGKKNFLIKEVDF